MEAPTQLTALLIGLKLGALGILRFAMPLTLDASVEYACPRHLGATPFIYAANDATANQSATAAGLRQYQPCRPRNSGHCNTQYAGIQARFFQLLNFSLIASCLILIVGFIQHRLGSTELIHLGGLAW
jgi:NADH-quinone oxidoreductase subunit M